MTVTNLLSTTTKIYSKGKALFELYNAVLPVSRVFEAHGNQAVRIEVSITNNCILILFLIILDLSKLIQISYFYTKGVQRKVEEEKVRYRKGLWNLILVTPFHVR